MLCKVCNKEINSFNLDDIFGIKKKCLCIKCFNEFEVINERTIIDEFECYSIYSYKGKIKDLIYQFKGLKDYELKDVFLEYFVSYLNIKYYGYYVTFAPSFFNDDKERGFNHVEAIFSSLNNKKIKLFKKKINYKQSDHKFNERYKIKDVIELEKTNLKGIKKILIVDDVLTSGNTLKTCASLLYKEGIKNIKLLTVSKASNNK